jgi:hypothetical protein
MSRLLRNTVAALTKNVTVLSTSAMMTATSTCSAPPLVLDVSISRLVADSNAKTPAAIGTVAYTENSDTWFAVASSRLGTMVTWMTCLAGWVNSPTASITNCATYSQTRL